MSALPAAAGEIAPGLARLLATSPPDARIRVLVVMEEKVDVKTLSAGLKEKGAGRRQRHRVVTESLQATAKRSQRALHAELTALKSAGAVRALHSHWLINGIVLTATPGVIATLASRPGVARIEPDLVVDIIHPTTGPELKSLAEDDLGVVEGIRTVWADRVWHELGIDGTGALVGSLDSGVDGHHPTLSDKWRGNWAPTEECWLDASDQGEPLYPVDHYFHGTHVMGTICGAAPGDSIGIAPGARWIASNVLAQDTGPEYDNDILRSLEFMTDPDGDPATVDDVPDVVQNSWGVMELFPGYMDCDSRWWDAIDNCEAAGVVLIWSAGNEGANPGTLRSPADRADTPLSSFSVGAVGGDTPLTAAEFSSRGPSLCGGPHSVKPEVVAPGVDVVSAIPGGGYAYFSGTSMSGPHVAGVVALMRSANPDIDVDSIKQILIDTAKDLGSDGEDTTYGHGMINAYDAVLAAMDGYHPVTGRVMDISTATPLAGVEVKPALGAQVATTDADGAYLLRLPSGSRTLEWNVFGYERRTETIEVGLEPETTSDIFLRPLDTAVLSGRVTTLGTLPVPAAEVRVLGTPKAPALTDDMGRFAIEVPVRASYIVQAQTTGMGADQRSLYFAQDSTVDFDLPLLDYEDFELGHFAGYPWAMSGDMPWSIDNSESSHGTFSARSGAIGNSQTSTLAMTVDVVAAGTLEFRVKTSTERVYDVLRFEIDGELAGLWYDEKDWFDVSFPIDVGRRTFTWSYIKDGSVLRGSDSVWIDAITFPALGVPPVPSLSVAPATAGLTLAAGQAGTTDIRIDNDGPGDMIWEAVATSGQPVSPPPPRSLVKGESVLSRSIGADKVVALPDPYGYVWLDGLEPDGPAFDWLEPPPEALRLALEDDGNVGPLSLGFHFPYYGGFYDHIRVCSNGWISFTSTATSYLGDHVPGPAEPNAVIAPFWTDLNPDSGGEIRAWSDPDGDRFVVAWIDVPHYPDGSPETFQVILHRDGRIIFQYAQVSDNTNHTIGFENIDGSEGMLILSNVPYLQGGMTFLIERRPPQDRWLHVVPNGGVLTPGESRTLSLDVDAANLPPGLFRAAVTLTTNDPDRSVVSIPVDLQVMSPVAVGEDLPDRPRLGAAVPNPFNPATTLSLVMPPGGGDVSLRLYDALGRHVRLLHSGSLPAGEHSFSWDGRDDRGRERPSGTYLLHLDADATRDVRKLQLLR